MRHAVDTPPPMRRTLLHSPAFWLILANFGVFLFLDTQGVNLLAPTPHDLIAWGGNLGPYTLTGEWPRLLYALFLHGGAVHLLLNMVLLAQVGTMSEAVWGRFRAPLIYLLCGLFGGLASAWWHTESALRGLEHNAMRLAFGAEAALATTVSVGASAAILGAAAALLVHALHHGHASRVDLELVFTVMLLDVGLGLFVTGIDNAAHVGGAVAGLVIGKLLVLPGERWRIGWRLQSAATFAACLALLAFLVQRPPSNDMVRIADRLRDTALEAEWFAALEARRGKLRERASAERAALPAPVSYDKAAGVKREYKGRFIGQDVQPGADAWYATDGASNTLARISLANLKMARKWSGPALPAGPASHCSAGACPGAAGVAAARDGSWAMVSAMVPDAVSRVDLATGAIAWSVPLGRAPRATFLSDNEQYAFVLHGLENVLSVVDVERRTLLFSTLVGGALRERPYGSPIVAVKGKGRLLLADPENNAIHAIDTEAPKAPRRVMSTGKLSPELMALSADGKTLAVAGPGGMLTIDPRTFGIVDRFFTCFDKDITALAVSPDGGRIAVNSSGGRGIRIVSAASQRVVGVLPAPDGRNALHFADDGKSLYLFTTLRSEQPRAALRRFDLARTLDVEANAIHLGEVFCLPQGRTRSAAWTPADGSLSTP